MQGAYTLRTQEADLSVRRAIDGLAEAMDDPASAEKCCTYLCALKLELRQSADFQANAEAAIRAVINVVRAHGSVSTVVNKGCRLLHNMLIGDEAAARRRAHFALGAGAIAVVCAALHAHADKSMDEAVQTAGCAALRNLTAGNESLCTRSDEARRAIAAVVHALRQHSACSWGSGLAEQACGALRNLCSAPGAAPWAQSAVDAGAVPCLLLVLRRHTADADVASNACAALNNLCAGDDDGAEQRRNAVAGAGAAEVIKEVLRVHARHAEVQELGGAVQAALQAQQAAALCPQLMVEVRRI